MFTLDQMLSASGGNSIIAYLYKFYLGEKTSVRLMQTLIKKQQSLLLARRGYIWYML